MTVISWILAGLLIAFAVLPAIASIILPFAIGIALGIQALFRAAARR